MSNYLIRSMTTTDYRVGKYAQLPTPYHIYLMKPEKRRGAYWTVYCGDVMQFETIDDALAHGAAALSDNRFDVVPVIDLDLPTYWEIRDGKPGARMIGTEIVERTQ